jgi:hypothetical protein
MPAPDAIRGGKKTSQIKNLEPRFDSIETAKAPERDDDSKKSHPALSFCLSMISGKRFAFVPRENRYPPIGSWPEGKLFRLKLQAFIPR